jgi:hypothetical protein
LTFALGPAILSRADERDAPCDEAKHASSQKLVDNDIILRFVAQNQFDFCHRVSVHALYQSRTAERASRKAGGSSFSSLLNKFAKIGIAENYCGN